MHGVKTKQGKSGTPSVKGVKSGIIALIGTAPIFDVADEHKKVNEPVMITDSSDITAYFGYNRWNYTIPMSLQAIYDQGGATVYVINVFDPEKHKSNVSSTLTFEKGKITLKECGITNLSITKASETMTLDVDYTFKDNVITVKEGGKLSQADEITAAYDYADPSKVTVADIIGGVDVDGNKTGLELLKVCKSLFGNKPRIIIAPVYSATKSVVDKMAVRAEKLHAVYYADAPLGTTIADAIKGRGDMGTINFNTLDKRCQLFYPHYRVYNPNEDSFGYFPQSPYWAGLRAVIDKEKGVHWSTSNHAVNGIDKTEIPIGFELSDEESDHNTLNDIGISTTVNVGGEYRTMGNRNASYPTNADIDSFECVVRTADYIDDSIEEASLNLLDGPISTGLIDDIVNMGKNFLANLIGKGWIIGGDCWFNPAKNTANELAKGHIIISRSFCPPPPCELIEYESDIDINYLSSIGGSN